MYKSYKTELNPTENQKKDIETYFKVCISAYNHYLKYNFDRIEKRQLIRTPAGYIKLMKDGKIQDSCSEFFTHQVFEHAVLYILKNAEKGLNLYLNKQAGRPVFKKQGTKNVSIHFTASSIGKPRLYCQRHRIFIPYFGWIRLKEKGYIPYDSSKEIISGWIKKSAGRYYVSALVKEKEVQAVFMERKDGIGIDLNVNNFAYLSDGTVFENINKLEHIVKLERKLIRETRTMNRRINAYLRLDEENKKKCARKNYQKQLHEVDLVYKRMEMIRKDYVRKCIKTVVDKNPSFIAVEDLHVTEMVADTRYGRYISKELFYQFKLGLYRECRLRNIEFRVVNKWYPSTKICHACGFVNDRLLPSEREFICPSCGNRINRDYNASLNIRDTEDYVVWKN